ncbi:MAG: hypothetical protein ACREMB_02830 [Candidatus Rokuibacteriota bacterium]
MSQPLQRIIVIVRRDQRELYARMRERYDEVAFVTLDRRRTERRRADVPVTLERRHGDRRQPWTTSDTERWQRLGYRLLYRTAGVDLRPTE